MPPVALPLVADAARAVRATRPPSPRGAGLAPSAGGHPGADGERDPEQRSPASEAYKHEEKIRFGGGRANAKGPRGGCRAHSNAGPRSALFMQGPPICVRSRLEPTMSTPPPSEPSSAAEAPRGLDALRGEDWSPRAWVRLLRDLYFTFDRRTLGFARIMLGFLADDGRHPPRRGVDGHVLVDRRPADAAEPAAPAGVGPVHHLQRLLHAGGAAVSSGC